MSLRDLDAEVSVLGAMILGGEEIAQQAKEHLEAEDFSSEANMLVWCGIQSLIANGSVVDEVALCGELKRIGTLEKAGGVARVSGLVDRVPTFANMEHYARIVRECSKRRQLIEHHRDMVTRLEQGNDPSSMRYESLQWLDEFDDGQKSNAISLYDASKNAFKVLEAEALGDPSLSPMETGITSVDDVMVGGVRRGWYYTLGGSTSMGKTAMALAMTIGLGRNKHRGLIFSLEMRSDRLARRVLSMEGVPSTRISHGKKMTMQDWNTLGKSIDNMRQMPVSVWDDCDLSVEAIDRIVREHKRRSGLDFVVLDYMQLMDMQRSYSREQSVGETSRALKNIATKNNIALISLVQLNNENLKRDDKRPQLADIRESSRIAHDSDCVMFIHRAAVYDESAPKIDAELIVRKNRDLPIGTANLRWKFENMVYGSSTTGSN